MRCFTTLTLAFFCFFVARASADDKANAVIEKAIKAHGGQANLTKYKAVKVKVEGVVYEDGKEFRFAGSIAGQLPDKLREEIQIDLGEQKVTSIRVLNGRKGWRSENGKTEELKGVDLDRAKDEEYQNYLENLVPLLKDKQIQVSLIGDDKVNDKPVAGVKISAKGYTDRKFFFDKESGLLVKIEQTMERDGRQMNIESFFSDYKPINGVMFAMKQAVHRDGQKYIENDATDCQKLEKLDNSTFAKP